MPIPLAGRLTLLATSLALPAAAGARPAAQPDLATQSPRPRALPTRQQVRVNDTLVLELTRPLARFTVYARPGATPVYARPSARIFWRQAALRGRRGYYQVLDKASH